MDFPTFLMSFFISKTFYQISLLIDWFDQIVKNSSKNYLPNTSKMNESQTLKFRAISHVFMILLRININLYTLCLCPKSKFQHPHILILILNWELVDITIKIRILFTPMMNPYRLEIHQDKILFYIKNGLCVTYYLSI